MGFKEKIKTNTKEKLTLRFFTALFLSCVLFMIIAFPVPFDNVVFFRRVPFLPFIASLLGFYALLSVIFTFVNSLKIERLILLVTYAAYAVFATFETTDLWFSFGASLVLLFICVYIFKDDFAPVLQRDIPKGFVIAAAVSAVLYFSVFVGVQTVCRYLTHSTPNYDFGIFSQMFYYMKTTLMPLATSERDTLMSHFSVHVSPAYYLFLPFYAIFPSPATLMVCQAVFLASGVIPVVLICKKLRLSNKAACVFAVVYALYPALAGGCFFDLHENKMLSPLLLWLFYFIVKNKWYGIAVFSALVLLVKEDAAVYVIFAGIYVLISAVKRDKLKGLYMILLAAAYFTAVTILLNKFGEGTMDERYANYMTTSRDTLFTVVQNIIKDPAYVVRQMFDTTADAAAENKVEFMLRMFIPLGFMPFITKKLHRYVLFLPLVLINLMSDYVYQHGIFFQYTYGPLAFLIFASMINYADMSERLKRTLGTFAAVAVVIICAGSVWQQPNYYKSYLLQKEQYDAVREAIYSIPEDAAVGATTFYCAPASKRRQLYELRYTEHKDELDYVILDLRIPEGTNLLPEYERDPDYKIYYMLDGWVAIFKK